jgi:hypothetical protein
MPKMLKGVIRNYKDEIKNKIVRLNLDTENVEIRNYEYWYLHGEDPFDAPFEEDFVDTREFGQNIENL